MPSPRTIRAFQTHRQYTAHGQRIAYAEISRDADEHVALAEVAFVDVDRGIDGVLRIAVLAGEAIEPRYVLDGYDHGGYGYSSDQAMKDALKAAALAL
jgi:hypothetical protein